MFVHRLTVWRLNTVKNEEIPYIAYPGDLIEIDHRTNDIRVNGESRPFLKDFGAHFFPLKKGANPIFYLPSSGIEINIEWRERFL